MDGYSHELKVSALGLLATARNQWSGISSQREPVAGARGRPAQVPLNDGLRFSMKSLLAKHCSTISAQRARLRLLSSFTTSPTMYLTAFTVSGALPAMVSA